MAFGLLVLMPMSERSRLALIAAGAAFLLDRVRPEVAALLVVGGVLGAWASDEDRAWRLPVAGAVLAAGGLVAAKQLLGASVLAAAMGPVAAVIWVAVVPAAFVAGVADTAAAGRALALAGVVALVSGQWFAAQLPALPLEAAAAAVEQRRAWRQQPALRDRAIEALASGAPPGNAAVSRVMGIAPRDRVLGAALVERWGAEAALAAGWQPTAPLAQKTAVAAAWALERDGQLGRAVQLLREHPRHDEVAWALSLMAGELGDAELAASSWPRALYPPDVATAPGVLIDGVRLFSGRVHEVHFGLTERATALLVTARGTSWKGAPRLEVRIADQRWELEVPNQGHTWQLPVRLPPAAYRVRIRLLNDASGIGGDRNLHDVRVELRGQPG